jgi:hypothetical protein
VVKRHGQRIPGAASTRSASRRTRGRAMIAVILYSESAGKNREATQIAGMTANNNQFS